MQYTNINFNHILYIYILLRIDMLIQNNIIKNKFESIWIIAIAYIIMLLIRAFDCVKKSIIIHLFIHKQQHIFFKTGSNIHLDHFIKLIRNFNFRLKFWVTMGVALCKFIKCFFYLFSYSFFFKQSIEEVEYIVVRSRVCDKKY